MPGKFGNGNNKQMKWHRMRGNGHWADKRVETHEGNGKHASVRDGEANPNSLKGAGTSMYEANKQTAASNIKQPGSIYGRSSNNDEQHGDCTYVFEQTDSNGGRHLHSEQIVESGRDFGQSNAEYSRSKIHHMFHQDNGSRAQKSPSKTKWASRRVPQCSKHFRNGIHNIYIM